MIDRRKLKNGNGVICGTPGSGIRLCAKQEILKVLNTSKDEVIVIDLFGDFVPMAKEFGGEVVSIGKNNDICINPLDLRDDSLDHPMYSKDDFLESFFETILSTGTCLTPKHRILIDKCMKQIYKNFVTADDVKIENASNKKFPTLHDFYNVLRNQSGDETLELSMALEVYVKCFSKFFSGKTTHVFQNRFTVFNLHSLPTLLKNGLSLVVLEHVWNHIVNSREGRYQNGLKNIWLYLDDTDLLFRSARNTLYLPRLFRIGQRIGLLCTFMTNNISSLLSDDNGKVILGNCSYIQILNQSPADAEHLAEFFSLKRKHLSFISSGNPGKGLIVADDSVFPFQRSDSEGEYNFEVELLCSREKKPIPEPEKRVKEVQTVDSKQFVPQGSWNYEHRCTNCGGLAHGVYNNSNHCVDYEESAYCHHCGAKMS